MIAWPFNANLLPMLEFDNHVNPYPATAIVTSLNVFCSVFVGVPFLHMLFGLVIDEGMNYCSLILVMCLPACLLFECR